MPMFRSVEALKLTECEYDQTAIKSKSCVRTVSHVIGKQTLRHVFGLEALHIKRKTCADSK